MILSDRRSRRYIRPPSDLGLPVMGFDRIGVNVRRMALRLFVEVLCTVRSHGGEADARELNVQCQNGSIPAVSIKLKDNGQLYRARYL